MNSRAFWPEAGPHSPVLGRAGTQPFGRAEAGQLRQAARFADGALAALGSVYPSTPQTVLRGFIPARAGDTAPRCRALRRRADEPGTVHAGVTDALRAAVSARSPCCGPASSA
jgi:hypothetical protein